MLRRFSRIPQAGSLEENFFPAIFISDDAALHASVPIQSSENTSAAAPAHASLVRLFATADTWISIAPTPTAQNKLFLPAGIIEYFGIDPNDLIATYRAGGSDGTLYVSYGGTLV